MRKYCWANRTQPAASSAAEVMATALCRIVKPRSLIICSVAGRRGSHKMTQLPLTAGLMKSKVSVVSTRPQGVWRFVTSLYRKVNVGTSSDGQVRNTRCRQVCAEPMLLPSQAINLCLIVLSLKVTGVTFRTILTTSQATHRASITKVTS